MPHAHATRYVSCLQSLLAACGAGVAPHSGSGGDLAAAGRAAEEVARLVLWRREHEDRRALFSHYYHVSGRVATQGRGVHGSGCRRRAAKGLCCCVILDPCGLQRPVLRPCAPGSAISTPAGCVVPELAQLPKQRWRAAVAAGRGLGTAAANAAADPAAAAELGGCTARAGAGTPVMGGTGCCR